MDKYRPNEIEKQFIDAFSSLKESLIDELVKRNEPFEQEMWNTYQEIDALITRLYAGEEQIIGQNQDLEIIS